MPQASPVKPSEFAALVPEPTDSVCSKLSSLVLGLPEKIRDLVNWLLDANGNISQAVKDHIVEDVFSPGFIMPSASNVAADGWVLCDGQELDRSDNESLFTAIGTTWGAGDGVNTFNVPDLRGRVIVGAGQAPGLSKREVGDTIGSETHELTVAEMPAHNHRVMDTNRATDHTAGIAQSGAISGDTTNKAAFTSQETTDIVMEKTGEGKAHNNVQPSAVLYYFIKT